MVGAFVFLLARGGVAEPTKDTPISSDRTAERRLLEWATQQRVALSLSVVTLPDGRHVSGHDASTPRNPASLSKLLTAAVALQSLGPAYQFTTTIRGDIENGHAKRLAIRGDGDPSLSSDVLQMMAARLAALGVAVVDEPIVVDQSFFDQQFVPPAFDQQPNEWAAFRAPVCATAVDGNLLTVRVLPRTSSAPAQVLLEPFGAAVSKGSVHTIDGETKGARIRVSVDPGLAHPSVHVKGEIGEKDGPLLVQRRTEDPRMTAGLVLREALSARGVRVPREVRLEPAHELPILFTHESQPLTNLLVRLGKDSDNFAAEMLLKAIGAKVSGIGSSEAGAKVVLDRVAALGVPLEGLRFINGSGLFDANRTTTNLLVRLLARAYADKGIAPEFLAQLSIGGRDGTLAKRFRTLPTGCLVRAKTGTLRSTISLAGYVDRADGTVLAFAIIAEQVKDQVGTRAQIDRYVSDWCAAPLPN